MGTAGKATNLLGNIEAQSVNQFKAKSEVKVLIWQGSETHLWCCLRPSVRSNYPKETEHQRKLNFHLGNAYMPKLGLTGK